VIDPARPASAWRLDGEAASDVIRLAGAIGTLGVDGIVSSAQPKAIGTAQLIGEALEVSVEEDAALGEQGGETVRWMASPEAFTDAVRRHFEDRSVAVLGDESSAAAAERFSGAVERARVRYRFPVLVTHGRVMCAYLGVTFGIDPMRLWESLRMPDAFMVDFGSGSVSPVRDLDGWRFGHGEREGARR